MTPPPDTLHLWWLGNPRQPVPTAQGLSYQQMRVGRDHADSTLDNALSEHAQFGLSLPEARTVVAELTRVTRYWKECFAQNGLSAKDIDLLARTI